MDSELLRIGATIDPSFSESTFAADRLTGSMRVRALVAIIDRLTQRYAEIDREFEEHRIWPHANDFSTGTE